MQHVRGIVVHGGHEAGQQPLGVAVALPGVVPQVEAGDRRPVRVGGGQHARQPREAAPAQVQPPHPPRHLRVLRVRGPGLGVQPVEVSKC